MINKYELNKMLNSIPIDRDTIIILKRSMGDTFNFFNYEKHKIRLFDDHLIFYDDGTEYKIMYHNIIQIKWRPIFKDKPIVLMKEGQIIKKNEGDSDLG